jgi:hypothetical protein
MQLRMNKLYRFINSVYIFLFNRIKSFEFIIFTGSKIKVKKDKSVLIFDYHEYYDNDKCCGDVD